MYTIHRWSEVKTMLQIIASTRECTGSHLYYRPFARPWFVYTHKTSWQCRQAHLNHDVKISINRGINIMIHISCGYLIIWHVCKGISNYTPCTSILSANNLMTSPEVWLWRQNTVTRKTIPRISLLCSGDYLWITREVAHCSLAGPFPCWLSSLLIGRDGGGTSSLLMFTFCSWVKEWQCPGTFPWWQVNKEIICHSQSSEPLEFASKLEW